MCEGVKTETLSLSCVIRRKAEKVLKLLPFTLHSFTHSLIHSFTHSLIHSFTHSLIHSFTHSLIHALSNNFKVPLQLPVGDGLAELAFLPLTGGGEVLDERIAETRARCF